jgi:signal transduction histidine kinase
MPTTRKTAALRWLAAVAVGGAILVPVDAVAAAETKQVLVLYSTSRDSPMSTAGDVEVPRVLEQGLQQAVAHYPEYIDQGRFPDAGYQAALSDFLRVKYKGQRIDLIFAIQSAAIEFISQRRDELFAGTPVVFLSLAAPTVGLANATGIIANLDLARTITLAIALQPDLRNVFVVSGAGVPDITYEREARRQLQPFESRLSVTYLSGLPDKDLATRLATLPDHSMVYYLVVYQDGAGQTFAPMAYSERVSAAARAPTYTWSDALMDHGVIGGSLLDRRAMMEAVAQLGLRVLQGETADRIPPSSPDVNTSQVDWRQLRRWGISESRVPAGTVVMFRELTVWDRYRFYILGAGALLVAQTLLIAGLLVQSARRREAEERVRGNQAELRASYDRIRDLGGRLLRAQETERSRIARELHDDVSQQIALLAIDLELLNTAGGESTEKQAAEAMTRAQSIAKSVHDLSHRLHPAKLRLLGLVAALEALRRELSRAELPIAFTHDGVPENLSPEVTLCLFRIVQEALQNALKHSKANEVFVRLHGGPDRLVLTIADDGVGFDVDADEGKGLGLISMRERLETLAGKMDVRSARGNGTRIEVTVPIEMPHGVDDGETRRRSDVAV